MNVLRRSRPWRSGLTALAGSALVAIPAAQAAPAGSEPADDIPVEQSFAYAVPTGDGSFVGAVHMVRRVPGGTVLYWSVGGVEQDGQLPDLADAVRLRGDFNDVTSNRGLYTVRLVDTAGNKVYWPLKDGSECLCTSASDLPGETEPEQLHLMYAVFPPLPDSVETVEVDVNGYGGVVSHVPVSDGDVPQPAPEEDVSTVPLGQGWPQPPGQQVLEEAAESSDPSPVWDLVVSTGRTDDSERVTEQGDSTEVALAADVLFAFGEAELTDEARTRLEEVATRIGDSGATQVVVIGHTDDVGSDAFNQDLSEQRAASVESVLGDALPEVEFTVEGRGESEPVASNGTDEGRQLTRRVTITFEGEQG